jgi:succinate dehydrogenase / fumarate reductase iron-sulfur subunit
VILLVSFDRRVRTMVAQMDAEAFGACTSHGECEAVCPKEISLDFIARMNRDYIAAMLKGDPATKAGGGEG